MFDADKRPGPVDGVAGAGSGSADQLQRALELGYAYLNQRDRTVSEVRRHLERKGISEGLSEAVIQTLAEQHLVDDARFARLFVSDKRELGQWGSERIRRGLLARGVDRGLADAALDADGGGRGGDADGARGEAPESELDRALEVLRRRFPTPPEDRRERQRALGVLLRKGYESELALDALAAHAHGG
jgi:regulatory protein